MRHLNEPFCAGHEQGRDDSGVHGACPLKWGDLQENPSAKPAASWASVAHVTEKPPAELQRQRRKLQDRCGSGGTRLGLMSLGHWPETDHSQSGCLGEGVCS